MDCYKVRGMRGTVPGMRAILKVTAWVDIGKTAKQRCKTWDSSFARCDRLHQYHEDLAFSILDDSYEFLIKLN